MAGTAELRLRPEALEWREVEGEIVAVDLSRSEYLAVNRTGAVLWPVLAEGTSHKALVARLIDDFQLDEANATHDVDAFLDALAAQGLLERG